MPGQPLGDCTGVQLRAAGDIRAVALDDDRGFTIAESRRAYLRGWVRAGCVTPGCTAGVGSNGVGLARSPGDRGHRRTSAPRARRAAALPPYAEPAWKVRLTGSAGPRPAGAVARSASVPKPVAPKALTVPPLRRRGWSGARRGRYGRRPRARARGARRIEPARHRFTRNLQVLTSIPAASAPPRGVDDS